MKYFLNILFLLSFCNCFSQNSYPAEPAAYKKMHFVYEAKSNLFFDEKGIYADTTLCRIAFPGVRFAKTKHPKEDYSCGFISFLNMDEETKKKVMSMVYHGNESFVGTYDFKKNTTTIKAVRYDAEAKKLFNDVFNAKYSKFTYTIYLDYKKKLRTLEFPSITYERTFYEDQKKLKRNSVNQIYFIEERADLSFTNVVSLNENLSKLITFGYVLENNDFGLEKLSTTYVTIQLKSVSYE